MKMEGEFEYSGGKSSATLHGPRLVTEAARQAGLVLNTSCAGRGACGGCTVELLAGTYQRDGKISTVLEGQRLRVLGCQTRIMQGRFRIFVPRRSLVETGEQVVADFVLENHFQHNPTVKSVNVTLPQAKLGDPRGDYERLRRVLLEEHDLELVRPTLSALRVLPQMAKSETSDLTVRLAWRHDDAWELMAVDPANSKVKTYGIAIDIGTTTVAVGLVDIDADKIVDTVTCYNQQIQQADDVAARIVFAGDSHGLGQLHRLIVEETLNPMIALLAEKHNIDQRRLLRAAVAGNTVMWHLFLGIDPTPLGAAPFPLSCNYPGGFRARELGLNICPEAIVDIVPSISAYVGGDIVGDIYICRLDETSANTTVMMIDVGTNGEIALAAGGELLTTACAAGPAFEGLRISCGMRASVGAIERITLDPDTHECRHDVIGDSRPVGICGSGLIDFLAEAMRVGLVNHTGKFNRDLLGSTDRLRMIDDSNILEYVVAGRRETEDQRHDLTITEKDIETLLQAKAAIFAAISILLRRVDRKPADLEKVYLAGGFAKYIHIENAITIGLFPEIDPAKYVVVGNGSLAGAFMGLIDRDCWPRFRQLLSRPEVVELNMDPSFQDEFTCALFLPNLEEDLFPDTVRRLRETVTNDGA